jgi:hypothetical protein
VTFKHSIRSPWTISNWSLPHTKWQRQILQYWQFCNSIMKYFLGSETVSPTQRDGTCNWKFHDRTSTMKSDSRHSGSQNVCYVTPWRWTRPFPSQSRRIRGMTSNLTAGNVNFRYRTSLTLLHPLHHFFFWHPPFRRSSRYPSLLQKCRSHITHCGRWSKDLPFKKSCLKRWLQY